MASGRDGKGREASAVRTFPYERAFSIALRSLHLVGAGAVTGEILLGPPAAVHASRLLWLAVATGLVLQLNDVYRYGLAYFSTAMFWLVFLKLLLLGLAFHLAPVAAPCIVFSVLLSGIVSHMSGSWRHKRFFFWPSRGG